MKKVFAVTVALALLCLGISAQADVFNLGTGFTNLDTITVGDPGNAGELSGAGAGGNGTDRTCGSVGYTYKIGKYEVTAKQYTDFLNAVASTDTYGLYNTNMWSSSYGCKVQRTGTPGTYTYTVASEYANRPVNCVSYWDACRFANWLGNGQPTGLQGILTTERGTYTLNGYNGVDGRSIGRNASSKWAVTSEDEWYKAAYYKGGGTNASYWEYPTSSNTAPGRDMGDASGNNANYGTGPGAYPIDSNHYTTIAGEFQNSASPYGTFDQGGNVWEWNESIVYEDSIYADRGLRGGSYSSEYNLQASWRQYYTYPTLDSVYFGFRVSEVPEPPSILALASGLAVIFGIRRRAA